MVSFGQFASLYSRRCLAVLAFLSLAATVGCNPEVVAPVCDKPLCSFEVSGKTKRTVVNATDKEAWIYLSLKSGAQVSPGTPKTDKNWDLGFQRYFIKINGGINGNAGMAVAFIEGDQAAFEGLTKAPAEGKAKYLADKKGEDENGDPFYAFLVESKWYAYDFVKHVLEPRDRIYIVKAASGTYYKVRMESYYNAEATSGYPSFVWAPIEAP